jgi:hypothetical protein
MDGRCDKHQFEVKEGTCRQCGGEFCGDCLVYSYGPKKPPYCVNCALSAAGVRSTAARAVSRSKREIKRDLKTQKRQQKLATKARATNDVDALFDARPVPASVVQFEFTINDDGTTDRPGAAPIAEPDPEPIRTSTSLFDQVEPVDQAS